MLEMRWQCGNVHLQPREPAAPWAASKAALAAGQGAGFCPSALMRVLVSHGVLHPALEFLAQDDHGPVGANPEEGNRDDQRDEIPLLQRQAEKA